MTISEQIKVLCVRCNVSETELAGCLDIMKAEDVKEFRLGKLFCGPEGLALAAITAQIDDPEYNISASGIMVLCKACDRYLDLLNGHEKNSLISDERIMNAKRLRKEVR